ncbi:MAG: hypothetical protein OXH94_03900 [Rhodospirillales bacterium]|nr:hypothetical protein [Rhodospirillales bacterium]
MTPQELANELSRMYRNAPRGDTVAMIHLFGIIYADQLRDSEESTQRIVERSDIPDSYYAEVNKGMNLARFVVPRSG